MIDCAVHCALPVLLQALEKAKEAAEAQIAALEQQVLQDPNPLPAHRASCCEPGAQAADATVLVIES